LQGSGDSSSPPTFVKIDSADLVNVSTTSKTKNPPGFAPPVNRVPTWLMPLITVLVLVSDGVLATACFLMAFRLRQGSPILAEAPVSWSVHFGPYVGILLFVVPVRVALLIHQRVYRFQGAFSYTQEAIRVFYAILVSSLLTVAWAFLFRGGYSFREFSYSRGVFLFDFVLSLAAFSVFHIGLRYIQVRFRERGINLIPTLVVGSDVEARQTVTELTERNYLGYRVVGIVRSGNGYSQNTLVLDNGNRFPILGDLGDLAAIIRSYDIQEVIITDNSIESDRLFEAMMQLGRRQRVEFRFAPSLFNVLPQKTSVEQIGVLPMVRLFREPLSDTQRFLKRLSDLVLGAAAGVLTSPIWIAAAVLVRLDSSGPILFRQERVGMDGRVFLCYKFRSMVADASEDIHRQAYSRNIEGDEAANAGDRDRPVFGKVKDDPRITRAGNWLRRTSIDELPQILNVLLGDMSIVGPRPPIPYEVREYDNWHRKRLDMKPGITGLWQVSGRNRLTFEEMVRVDLFYIENWSLLLDLKIILLTLPAVFRGDGAR
jgi:exopolysaccharide biosynthesis polyprenyl glycosylphosphotransferase